MKNLIERAKEALDGASPGPYWADPKTGDIFADDGEDLAEGIENPRDADLFAMSPDLARLAIAAQRLEAFTMAARNRLSLYSGGHDDALVSDLDNTLVLFRAIAEGKE